MSRISLNPVDSYKLLPCGGRFSPITAKTDAPSRVRFRGFYERAFRDESYRSRATPRVQ